MTQIGRVRLLGRWAPLPGIREVNRRLAISYTLTKRRHPEWVFDDATYKTVIKSGTPHSSDPYDWHSSYGWKAIVSDAP